MRCGRKTGRRCRMLLIVAILVFFARFGESNLVTAGCVELESAAPRFSFDWSHWTFRQPTSFDSTRLLFEQYTQELEYVDMDSCPVAASLWSDLVVMIELCELVTEEGQFSDPYGRKIVFVFDADVAPGAQANIRAQIGTEYDWVLGWFRFKLEVDLSDRYIVFLISQAPVFDTKGRTDIGGLCFGSFVWIPVDFVTLSPNVRASSGVRRSTLRHEIVHAMTNQVLKFEKYQSLPRDFHEGMAIYVAGNEVSSVRGEYDYWRLSEEYVRYHHLFKYLDDQFGRPAVEEFIARVLMNPSVKYEAELERLTGQQAAKLRSEAYRSSEWSGFREGMWRLFKYGIAIVLFIGIVIGGIWLLENKPSWRETRWKPSRRKTRWKPPQPDTPEELIDELATLVSKGRLGPIYTDDVRLRVKRIGTLLFQAAGGKPDYKWEAQSYITRLFGHAYGERLSSIWYGTGIRHQDDDNQEVLRKSTRPSTPSDIRRMSVGMLIDELARLASKTGFEPADTEDEPSKERRIGILLFEAGEDSLYYMLEAHAYIAKRFGHEIGQRLSDAWHNIGMWH